MITSSQYINTCSREFSLYTLEQRAISSIADGLKSSGRRVLWMARDGKQYKSATLAGSTLPIHPHASPEGTIDTLAAPYGNNIPLLAGDGAFGTLLEPTEYGASRYTSVSTSKFTNDVIFKDIEIVPMVSNYDNTLQQPAHFLPLIPVCLLNPTEGVAVGYATNILPRRLEDIVKAQLSYLSTAKCEPALPYFAPIDCECSGIDVIKDKHGFVFTGNWVKKDASTVTITGLLYGQSHSNVISKLNQLLDDGTLLNYLDSSRDVISIELKFKRGILNTLSDDEFNKMVGLRTRHIENMNLVSFSGDSIISTDFVAVIKMFTDWRLAWYVKRYRRLLDLLNIDLQKYYDIKIAIDNNVGSMARLIDSRTELKEKLCEIGIINLEYIADLPVYRFTQDERKKNQDKIDYALVQQEEYSKIISEPTLQKQKYVEELKSILSNHNKGHYSTTA